MKKILSMVLALVMAMSLVTISSSAAFTDAADIDYKEAVDVMTSVGIIDGYTDGSFGPDGYLSRGAAAKIVCNMILGVNNNLPTSAAPYSDVPAGSTFAGYIAYLQNEGLVSGYADGTFKPGNQLTGYAFMKMLLGALGYDGAIEGYTGNNWAVSVAKDGKAAGLIAGLTGVNFNGAITRQEALQMAFNAMKATMVEYPANTSIVVGDIKVTTTAEATKAANYSGVDFMGKANTSTMEFAEQYFTGLKANTQATDGYGRPATKWTGANNKAIGTYVKPATASYFYAQTFTQLRADLGIPATQQPTFTYIWNGETYATGTTAALPYASSAYSYTWMGSIGRGVKADFYYDAVASAAGNYANNKVVLTEQYIGKVSKVQTNEIGRYVTVDGKTFYTNNFAKGDYVIYTVYGANATIGSMAAAEKISGTVTWITTDTYYKTASYAMIDGVGYYNHGYDYFDDGKGAVQLTIGAKVDAWLDADGYIIKTEITEGAVALDQLALLTDKVRPVYDTNGDTVADTYGDWTGKIVYGDGKTETVTLYTTNAAIDTIYNYSTVSGKLSLVAPNGYSTKAGTAGTAFNRGDTKIGGIDVNGDTGFVYINEKTQAVIGSYIGYKNAPSIKAADGTVGSTKIISLVKNDEAGNPTGVASVVYVWVKANSTFNSSNEAIWLQTAFAYEYKTKVNGVNNIYHTVKTVEGENVNVTSDAYAKLFANVYAGAVAIDNLTYDAFGNIATFDIVSDWYFSASGVDGYFFEIKTVKDVLYINDVNDFWAEYKVAEFAEKAAACTEGVDYWTPWAEAYPNYKNEDGMTNTEKLEYYTYWADYYTDLVEYYTNNSVNRALAWADDVVVYSVNNAGTLCVEDDITSISGLYLGASYTLNDNGEVDFLVVKEAPANATTEVKPAAKPEVTPVDGYTGNIVNGIVYVDATKTGVAQTEAVIATLEAKGYTLEENLTVGQTSGIKASKGGINYVFTVETAVSEQTQAYSDVDGSDLAVGAYVDIDLTVAAKAGEVEVALKDATGKVIAKSTNKKALAVEPWTCFFSAEARDSSTWDAGCQDLGADVIAAAKTAEVYVFGVLAGTYAVEEFVAEV